MPIAVGFSPRLLSLKEVVSRRDTLMDCPTKEAGFFAHLVKPVMLGQLRLLLDQIAPPKA